MATPKRKDSWLPVSTMARVFDISAQGFRSSILPLLPAEAIRKGRPAMVHARTAIELWAKREFQPDVDPMLATEGVETPGLERYRVAKAQLAELELSVRRGQLVDLDEFLSWWRNEVAAPIRKSLERLQLAHGRAAVELVMQGVARATIAVDGSRKRDAEKA